QGHFSRYFRAFPSQSVPSAKMQLNVLKLKVCNILRSAAMSHNDEGFFLSEKSSKARLREAENARKNRAEIVKAFSQGKVTRRELVKWGLITEGSALA